MTRRVLVLVLGLLCLLAGVASAGVQRHYVLDCGRNIALLASSTVLIQGAEYCWAMAGPNKPAFGPSATITRLAGDRDLFGDGSVTILSTPGHTPGHQSLLVRLPKTGYVVLSGDAVHFRDNWDHKRVPAMNVNREP